MMTYKLNERASALKSNIERIEDVTTQASCVVIYNQLAELLERNNNCSGHEVARKSLFNGIPRFSIFDMRSKTTDRLFEEKFKETERLSIALSGQLQDIYDQIDAKMTELENLVERSQPSKKR